MPQLRPLPLLATTALLLAAPVHAHAQTSSYDDPLLSGYGNPGAAEQQVFGEQLLGGARGGGGTAGGGTAGGGVAGGVVTAESLRAAPGAAAPGASGATDRARGRFDRAVTPASSDGSDALLPTPAGEARGAGTDRTSAGLPLSGTDLVLAAVFLAAMLACAAAARRRTLEPLGR